MTTSEQIFKTRTKLIDRMYHIISSDQATTVSNALRLFHYISQGLTVVSATNI